MVKGYQISLPMVDIHDRSGRIADRPKMPKTRGECFAGVEGRRSGKTTCPHLTCRHNLVGELATKPAHEAEAAMVARLEGKWLDSCSLDIADAGGGVRERELSLMLGITREKAVQIYAEAASRLRKKL